MKQDQNKNISQFKKGDYVQIKGVYKGSLMDAILLNCVLIENSKE